MDEIQAWNEVFRLGWHTDWVKIPTKLVNVLELPKGIGISGNILCMRVSARGANRFIDRLNAISKKEIIK